MRLESAFGEPRQAGSGTLIDEVAIGGGPEADAKPKKAIEGDPRVASPVPAEDEFVEIALDMGLAQSVKDALGPSLEVREDPVDPFQHVMGLLPLDDAHLMRVGRRVLVAQPAIGDHPGARGDHLPDEPVQRLRGSVGDMGQTDAARLAVFGQLDRAHDEDLSDGGAPALLLIDRVMLRAERHLGLINLDEGLQQASFGIDHGAPEFLEQKPGGLVAADAQLALQLKGRDAVRVGGDDVGGEEPRLERQVAVMHEGAGGHRGLPPTPSAFPCRSLAVQRPGLSAATNRTNEPVWPALTDEVLGTGRVVRKPRLELLARHGAI